MSLHSPVHDAMKNRYIERRRADLNRLEEAFTHRDMEVFERIGHQLKGNAATFGYMDLESIAIDMEKAAQVGNFVEAARVLIAFRSWIESQLS